jgi:hypothetical protein
MDGRERAPHNPTMRAGNGRFQKAHNQYLRTLSYPRSPFLPCSEDCFLSRYERNYIMEAMTIT